MSPIPERRRSEYWRRPPLYWRQRLPRRASHAAGRQDPTSVFSTKAGELVVAATGASEPTLLCHAVAGFSACGRAVMTVQPALAAPLDGLADAVRLNAGLEDRFRRADADARHIGAVAGLRIYRADGQPDPQTAAPASIDGRAL